MKEFDIREKKSFVCDLDGTLFMGPNPIRSAVDFVIENTKSGRFKFFYLTNNTSKCPEEYMKKIAGAAIPVTAEQILTPLITLEAYIREKGYKSVYLLASEKVTAHLTNRLADAGGRRASIRCREGDGYRVIAEDLQGTGTVELGIPQGAAVGAYDLVMTVSDGTQTDDDEALNATLVYANRSIAYDANFRKLSTSVLSDRALDLTQGVRRPKTRELVFPFAYSITNFTGDVTDATGVRVRIVKVTGEGENVGEWTEEVPGTARTLFGGVGESTVRWPHPKTGVWRATFDIMSGEQPLKHYDSVFDLRGLSRGLMLLLY